MLSAVILAKNESQNISRCLRSLSFCEKIIVIDDRSTDTTSQIARKFGAQVISHHHLGNFASTRNFALSQVKSGWVLFIDADEEVSPQLASEISRLLTSSLNKDISSYFLNRYDFMWNRILKHGDNHIQLCRLSKAGVGKWQGAVHETLVVPGLAATLKSPLLHYPHPTLVEFLRDLNYYSTIRSSELYAQGRSVSIFSVMFLPVFKFIYLYIFKLGLLDGTAGLISALMMSFYTFLVRGKLYLLWRK